MVDSVTMSTDPAPAYTEEQVAAANTTDTQEGGDPNLPSGDSRPDGLPENFNSVEDLAKSYKELQGKFSQQNQQQPKQEGESNVSADDTASPNPLELEITKAQSDQVDMAGMSEEYMANGELGTESYDKLESLGFDRQTVDNYIQYQINNHQAPLLEAAGGRESYDQMTQWAAQSMTQVEQDAYNKAIGSDPATAMLAVEGLKSKYTSANGSNPSYIDGDTGAIGGAGFESWAQVTEAMSNPKYQSDPAYRASVERKLSASSL